MTRAPLLPAVSSKTKLARRVHVPPTEPSAATTTVAAPVPSDVATVLPMVLPLLISIVSSDLFVIVPVYVPAGSGLGLQLPEGAGVVDALGAGDAWPWKTR